MTINELNSILKSDLCNTKKLHSIVSFLEENGWSKIDTDEKYFFFIAPSGLSIPNNMEFCILKDTKNNIDFPRISGILNNIYGNNNSELEKLKKEVQYLRESKSMLRKKLKDKDDRLIKYIDYEMIQRTEILNCLKELYLSRNAETNSKADEILNKYKIL